RGHAEVLRSLLHRGSQPDLVDHRGWSALHYAGFGGQAASARALLQHGGPRAAAVLDAPNAKGETALALAAFGRRQECAEVLLSNGADLALLSNAADRAYLEQLAAAKAAAPNAGGGGGSSSGGAAQNGQPLASRPGAARRAAPDGGAALGSPSASARPGVMHQFSGSPSEYEQLASEPVSPQGLRPRRVPSNRTAALPALHDNGSGAPSSAAAAMESEQSPRPAADRSPSASPSPDKGDGASAGGAAAKEAAWELRERKFGGVPLLLHRPTGLLFTSVPADSFPHLVGRLSARQPHWLGHTDRDLQRLAGQPEALLCLAATVPVAALLLTRLGVIPGVTLRLCLVLGLHE
ncbi:Histone-lysine N-methyltransferase EHMT2, partial [Tetrabaena socialis]